MNFTLKNRIAFYYMTATAVITLLLFIVIYGVVHNAVYNHLDSDLENEASEVSTSFVADKDEIKITNTFEWLEKEHETVEADPVYIEVVDKKGNPIKKTGNLMDANLSASPSIDEKIFININFGDKEIRQTQIPIKNSEGTILGYLLVGKPYDEASLVLMHLGRVLIIGFPIVIVILFFVTRFMAEKSILPLKNVITEADKITKENIDERIGLPENKDEIYTLTQTINSLLDRLEDAVLREKLFTSDASHELRTPLSVIKGTLEVLIRKRRDIEQYESKIAYCINEVDRMSNTIDQLLMLARYESGKIEPMTREIELNENIRYLMLRTEPLAQEKGIEIKFNEDKKYVVKADPSMLEVILENLLTNSIKYSNGSKQIDIFLEKKGNKVFCSVKDYGIGMKAEQIARIFDRFYRSEEARNTQHSGDGIGLAIVKRLADIQNLDIKYESELNKGTIATISFPG